VSYGAVAEAYAKDHGLKYQPGGTLPCPPSRGRESSSFEHALVGPLGASQRPGIVYMYFGNRAPGPPAAQFAIAGLDTVIDGLCVRRSGTNFLTRQPLPKGYTELKALGEEFSSQYRAGVLRPTDEALARSLLDPAFTSWYVEHAPQGAVNTQAGHLDIAGGVLYVCGFRAFDSAEDMDRFAAETVSIADRVATWVPAA
jgi:hypothetical protein